MWFKIVSLEIVVLAVIDIALLFGGSNVSKKKIDRQILEAATSLGFMMVTGLPDAQLLTPKSRDQLKEIFQLPNSQKRALLHDPLTGFTPLPDVDSGVLTLLLQDGVPGLQVQDGDGTWQNIPPTEATLVVNFRRLLETLTSGRIRATPHRVVARNEERFSIAFFYEPSVDALIKHLREPRGPIPESIFVDS